MRFVLLSDTHGRHARLPPVPEGDVLVHAGDLTVRGTFAEAADALRWLDALPHRHKLLVAGNHDFLFERDPDVSAGLVRALAPGVTYLRDAGATVEGAGGRRLRVWGSPWQPWFHGWAFNLPRGAALAAVWARVPDDTEVLVTHTPPFGVLDRVLGPSGSTPRGGSGGRRAGPDGSPHVGGSHVGCEDLARRVGGLPALQLHAFGHVHEAYGVADLDGVRYVNASVCTAAYAPTNPPVAVDL